MKLLALCVSLMFLLVLGCAPTNSSQENGGSTDQATVGGEEKSLEEMREEAWAAIDKDACATKGGEVRAEGMFGMPRCVIPYDDAGAVCTTSEQCGGKCLGDDEVTDYNAKPGEMKGVCAPNDSPFGCYAEIIDGTADAFLCID